MHKKAIRQNITIPPSTHITGSLDRVGDGAPEHRREKNDSSQKPGVADKNKRGTSTGYNYRNDNALQSVKGTNKQLEEFDETLNEQKRYKLEL
jgi:hypothetical protein